MERKFHHPQLPPSIFYNYTGITNMEIDATEYKNIIILLSGGADSAMLLHEICNNSDLTKLSIHCITGIGSSANPEHVIVNDDGTFSLLSFKNKNGGVFKNDLAAKKIIKYIKEKFPEANITHDTFTYSPQKCLDLLAEAENAGNFEYTMEFFKEKGAFQYNVCPNKTVLDYKLVIVNIEKSRFFKKYGANTVFNGKTANPPLDAMTDLGMLEHRMIDRDTKDIKPLVRNPVTGILNQQPFRLIDKSMLAEMYYNANVMDMYMFTESCTDPFLRDGSNLPCKKCWWCREKHWAFGTYDFGIV